MSSFIFVLTFWVFSVQGMRWSFPLADESYTFAQLSESAQATANVTVSANTSSGVVASLFRDIAPHLYTDSQIRKMIERGVHRELEARMKFFPGITSLKQLFEWNTKVAGPRLGPVKDLPPITSKRRVMSVHDMASGYNEMSDNDYLMLFQSWEAVDIFVYFSHVRIAVPPLQWTMVAHQHKRPALGTLIFEPSDETTEFVSQMLAKRSLVQDRLVSLADHYGFDGWFINVENYASDWPEGDPERFVAELRHKLKMRLGKRAQVIAYPYNPDDAMFTVADGIFVNYNWGTDEESMDKYVSDAGARAADVYMGMDSFGDLRGDDTPDPEHVKVCADNDLSIAVFGGGYTLEVEAEKKYSKKAVKFDRRYWSSIAENFGRPFRHAVRSAGEWPIHFERLAANKSSSIPEVVHEDDDVPMWH